MRLWLYVTVWCWLVPQDQERPQTTRWNFVAWNKYCEKNIQLSQASFTEKNLTEIKPMIIWLSFRRSAHWQSFHGSGKVREKRFFFKVRGKSGNFDLSQGKYIFFVKSVKSQGILYQVFVIAYFSCWENSCFKKYPKCVWSADSTRTLGKTHTLWEAQLYTFWLQN